MKEEDFMEHHFGFKKLTIENILQPDTLGIQCDIKQEQWLSFASAYLEPQLSGSVPVETRKLFEVARGTMIYGLYFYPLYSMGTEQLFRVAENALRQKCMMLGIHFKDGKMYFGGMLNRLIKMSIIPMDRKQLWECFRNVNGNAKSRDFGNGIAEISAAKYGKTAMEVRVLKTLYHIPFSNTRM
jgi:hypothetical protein